MQNPSKIPGSSQVTAAGCCSKRFFVVLMRVHLSGGTVFLRVNSLNEEIVQNIYFSADVLTRICSTCKIKEAAVCGGAVSGAGAHCGTSNKRWIGNG
jgi:hypothetical protein